MQVNLLSTVLDTPEFFWSAPDSMQTLYKRVCEYMELDDRVEVLNNRFSVCGPLPMFHEPAPFSSSYVLRVWLLLEASRYERQIFLAALLSWHTKTDMKWACW